LASNTTAADWVRNNRKTVPDDNYFLSMEKIISQYIIEILNAYKNIRDNSTSNIVRALYGPHGFGAIFPPEQPEKTETGESLKVRLESKKAQLEKRFEEGGFVEAVVRILVAVIKKKGAAERRSYIIAEELRKQNGSLPWPTRPEFKKLLRDQTLLLSMDTERAIRSLPKLLPTKEERLKAVSLVTKILMLEPEWVDPKSRFAKRVKDILGVELRVPKSQ
jgi:hypothetical protein